MVDDSGLVTVSIPVLRELILFSSSYGDSHIFHTLSRN
jgi:hypothetical protein